MLGTFDFIISIKIITILTVLVVFKKFKIIYK